VKKLSSIIYLLIVYVRFGFLKQKSFQDIMSANWRKNDEIESKKNTLYLSNNKSLLIIHRNKYVKILKKFQKAYIGVLKLI
jgi:hypothetical protein